MKNIGPYLPKNLEKAWEITRELSEHADNAGGYSCLVEIEALDGKKTKYLFDCGWNYIGGTMLPSAKASLKNDCQR